MHYAGFCIVGVQTFTLLSLLFVPVPGFCFFFPIPPLHPCPPFPARVSGEALYAHEERVRVEEQNLSSFCSCLLFDSEYKLVGDVAREVQCKATSSDRSTAAVDSMSYGQTPSHAYRVAYRHGA